MESTVELRLAALNDAQVVSATLNAAFAAFQTRYTPQAFAATTPTPEQVAKRFREGPIWLAEEDGHALGTVSVVPRAGELYVRSMAVLPEAQGRGIGAELLRVAEAYAVFHGYGRIVLATTPFLQGAIRLYEHAGFRRTGEPADLFGTPLIRMVKDMPPAVRGCEPGSTWR